MKKAFLSVILVILFSLAINVDNCEAKTVVFNTKSLKYHDPSCNWARKCTKNCIKVEKEKAISKGGKPCKICGG